MSQGNFIWVKIEDVEDTSMIYWCRVQEETPQAQFGSAMNSEATMDATEDVSAWVGKSNRQPGFRPAIVNFVWDEGQQPTGYTGRGGMIACLTKSAFQAASKKNATGTYLTKMITIVSVTAQDIM